MRYDANTWWLLLLPARLQDKILARRYRKTAARPLSRKQIDNLLANRDTMPIRRLKRPGEDDESIW